MGGGHLSRPDFGMPQPDPDHPLTEFYLLLQHGLDKAGVFHLPALYASFRAPARRIYADEAAGCLTLSETADEGAVLLSAPRNLQLLYSSLHVEPDGSPAACARPPGRSTGWPTPKQICILRRKLPFSKGFIVNAIIRALHPYMG